ncbi:MAG: hypothetical protein PGN24_12015 [Microbacterium arborescens]
MTRMSPAALLSRWSDAAGIDVYRSYLTASESFAGLTAIHSPAPDERSNVNWLNIFYAVEWAVFAGFAFYMWYPPRQGRVGEGARGLRGRGRPGRSRRRRPP